MPSQTTRVLFWAADFGPGGGGGEVWSQRYITSMQQRGYQIEVLAADGEDREMPPGISVHRIFAGDALRSGDAHAFRTCIEKVATLQQRFQPHLLHLAVGISAPSLTLFLMACGSGLSRGNRRGRAAIGNLFYKWPEEFVAPGSLLERTLGHLDWLASDSQDTVRWVSSHWPSLAAHSVVIPQALPHFSSANYLPPSEPASQRIAYIGRLSKEKGPDLALRAFSLLRQSFPELRLILAGDGQERASLLALASELGVAEDVAFRGWLPEQEVGALIRSCSLVLMPSRQESFGLVALEAAREGRPVVATAVGGIPEVCRDGETAILCPPENPEALSAACARLLSNPSLTEQMGRAALAHFQRFYTWESHLDAYEDLMTRALQARGHATVASQETR